MTNLASQSRDQTLNVNTRNYRKLSPGHEKEYGKGQPRTASLILVEIRE